MKTKTKVKMLAGLLIDPYKQEMRRVEIADDLDSWREAMQCQWVEHHLLSREPMTNIDLFFDEEFAISGEIKPSFQLHVGPTIGGYPLEIGGYALVFASNHGGETISLETCDQTAIAFAILSQLKFERHGTGKLVGREFIEERMRNLELEMPGRFKYLTDNDVKVEGMKQ